MLIAALSLTLAAANANEDAPRSFRDMMLERLPESVDALDSHPEEDQGVQQDLTLLGREDLAQSRWPEIYTYRECPVERLMDGDALEALLDASGTAQIIMINEAHNQPLHRPFIRDFGLALAEQGVTVFAAETFDHATLSAMSGEFLPETIGFYTMEGSFARQVIALRAAGYDFVAYETADGGHERAVLGRTHRHPRGGPGQPFHRAGDRTRAGSPRPGPCRPRPP